jgi:hypothetical protein
VKASRLWYCLPEPQFPFGSVGYLAASHAAHPPFNAYTFLYPLAISCSATLALVASLSHLQ